MSCLKFWVPGGYLEGFNKKPIAELWQAGGRPDVLKIFHLNLYIAGIAANISSVDRIDPLDGCLYFARDHVYEAAVKTLPVDTPPGYADQWVWEIRGSSLFAGHPNRRMVRLGLPVINYAYPFETSWNQKLKAAMLSLNNPTVVTVFLGMPQQFAVGTFKAHKRLLVDEVYHTQVPGLQPLLDQSFNATMAVATILHEEFGWEVSSFVARWATTDLAVWRERYPFVHVEDLSAAGPSGASNGRAQLLNMIRGNTFYMSHMWET